MWINHTNIGTFGLVPFLTVTQTFISVVVYMSVNNNRFNVLSPSFDEKDCRGMVECILRLFFVSHEWDAHSFGPSKTLSSISDHQYCPDGLTSNGDSTMITTARSCLKSKLLNVYCIIETGNYIKHIIKKRK